MNTDTNINNNDEYGRTLKDALVKLAKAVQCVKAIQASNSTNVNTRKSLVNKKKPVVLHNKRTPGISQLNFYATPAEKDSYQHITEGIESALNVKVSRSIFVKQCIEHYQRYFVDCLTDGKSKKEVKAFCDQERQAFIKVAGRGTRDKRTNRKF